MKCDIDYSIYLVTDRDMMSTATLEEAVEEAIKGGCTIVQLREKSASSLDFYITAKKIREVTRKYGVPFIVNDRVDIALATDADGVHIGQSDIPAKDVRLLIGEEKLLGVSASNLAEALKAQEDGADYLGIGAMFSTNTKDDARYVSLEELKIIKEAVSLPIVAIGGINHKTLSDLSGTKIDGIAVVSAIIAKENIKKATEDLAEQFQNLIKGVQ